MPATPAQPDTLFPLVIGVPDNGCAKVKALPNGTLAYELAGNARVATDLEPAVKQRMLRVVTGPGVPLQVPPALLSRPYINSIGDADTCAVALGMLEAHLATCGAPCFNHPRAVLGTARERVSAKLAGIAGVIAPRTVRVQIEESRDLIASVDRAGLHWPLILRATGTHSGRSMVRLDSPADVQAALHGLAWGGRDLYLTEYVDYRDDDGRYRKMRLALVGGQAFIRHHIVADQWMIHFRDRELQHLAEEQRALATFHTDVLPQLANRLRAIADAIDLDYTGVDCNVRPDGSLLVFEINPLMDILTNTMPEPNCWDEPVRKIRAALSTLIVDPTRWRHPA